MKKKSGKTIAGARKAGLVRKLWMLRQATAKRDRAEARQAAGLSAAAHVRTSRVFRALLAASMPMPSSAAAMPKPSASVPASQPSKSSERKASSR